MLSSAGTTSPEDLIGTWGQYASNMDMFFASAGMNYAGSMLAGMNDPASMIGTASADLQGDRRSSVQGAPGTDSSRPHTCKNPDVALKLPDLIVSLLAEHGLPA